MDTGKVASFMSIMLGFVFTVGGAAKAYDWNETLAKNLRMKFTEWAQVYPLRPVGYIPDPIFYLRSVAVIELTLGVLLMVGPYKVRRYCCLALMFIMAGAVQTLICNEEGLLVINPAVFFISLVWTYSNLKEPKVVDATEKKESKKIK